MVTFQSITSSEIERQSLGILNTTVLYAAGTHGNKRCSSNRLDYCKSTTIRRERPVCRIDHIKFAKTSLHFSIPKIIIHLDSRKEQLVVCLKRRLTEKDPLNLQWTNKRKDLL